MRIDYPRSEHSGLRRWLPSWKQVLGFFVALAAAGFAVFAIVYVTTDVPEPNEVAAAQTSIIYYDDGERELARLGDTNRIVVPLSDVPIDTQHAVLAAEDRDFYEHRGFDLVGIARAMWNNLTSDTTSGGSTITQQLAKNYYLTDEQTWIRKFKEAVLTVKIERTLTKDQILQAYLNVIYYGRGAYGIQTGAEKYFDTDSQDLTLEQGAILASVINGPGNYNPEDPEGLQRLKDRYAYVLNGMVEEGWLTPEARDAAIANFPEIEPRSHDDRFAGPTGHLMRAVADQLEGLGFSDEQINAGGLRIVSTFNRTMQKAAVNAVKEQQPTSGMDGVRIGLAAVEPKTGEVRALYGGADYIENSYNNATQARYQAGSTFKPFGLAAATEAGIGLHSLWPGNNGTKVNGYKVNNYGQNSYGAQITLLKGTEESVNTVYVSVEADTGVPAVHGAAVRAGIPEDTPGMDNGDLTFVLGTASPHTLDIAHAYTAFASRGVATDGTSYIRSVTDAPGTVLYTYAPVTNQAFQPGVADTVNYALQKVVTNGTGSPAQGVGRPVAAKTGTTDEYKSSWFAGYVPQLAAAVSFGKSGPNGEELSLSGVGGMSAFYGSGYPARIWTAFMSAALVDTPVQDFVDPETITSEGGEEPLPTPTPTPTPTPSGSAPVGSPAPTPPTTPAPTP